MKEVEVKARVQDIEALKDKLVLLWFFFSQQLFQHDRIYLSNDMAYMDIKQWTVSLRIRNSNGKYSMTLKRKWEDELDSIHREVGIDDSEQAAEILKYMWYYQVVEISKVRQKASYNGLTICLDEVDGLGSFIDVR